MQQHNQPGCCYQGVHSHSHSFQAGAAGQPRTAAGPLQRFVPAVDLVTSHCSGNTACSLEPSPHAFALLFTAIIWSPDMKLCQCQCHHSGVISAHLHVSVFAACLFLPLQHLQVMNAKVATAHECKGRNWHGCCKHNHRKVRGGNISRHSSEWWHWHHLMSTVKVINHVSAGLSGCLCRSNSSGHSFCSMPSSFYCPPAWSQMPCLASITLMPGLSIRMYRSNS